MTREELRDGAVTLPDGRRFDLRRPRSAGPLDAAELAWCRENAIALAYDPAQIGWVVADAADDIDMPQDAPAPPRDPASGRAERPADDAGDAGEAGADLRLRRWRASDVPLFVHLLDDPEVWRYLPEPYPDPLSEALARELIELSNSAAHHEVRAVEIEGETVGQVRLAHDPGDSTQEVAEISYWLGREHWGRGLGKRMVARFTAQCFRDRPGLRAIIARVHSDNPASARALESAGYRREGPAPEDPDIIVFRLTRAQARAGDSGADTAG